MATDRLAIYLLGEPRIERNNTPLQFDTRKATALLAYLAVSGESHSREALAAMFYPESDQARARGALRRTLAAVKQALGERWLDADRESIGLIRRPGLVVDVERFHSLIGETYNHGHATNDVCSRCLEPLGQAVRLVRADFLSGFTLRDSPDYDDWQFFESESLRRELVTSLAKLSCRASEDRHYEAAIEHTRRWLSLEPLEEPGHRQLMRLYVWTGQRSAALRQYHECVRLLEQELGVAPLAETTQLYQDIEQDRLSRPRGAAHELVPSAHMQTAPTAPLSGEHEPVGSAAISTPSPYPLVGRQRELDTLLRLFEGMKKDGRFVVLEGEAGIGKTRLADEFLVRERARGVTVMTARGYEGQANLAYGPFVESLRPLVLAPSRAWLEHITPQAIAEASRLLPELASLHHAPVSSSPLEGPGAQTRFLDSISQLLMALCCNLPGVLFIDDLQWVDTASLDLLTYLVRRLPGRALYILATWRSEDVPPDHRLRQLLSESRRAGTGNLIELERLDRAAVMSLVGAVHEGSELSPEQAERLYRESEGQPFFLVEYLSLLAAGGPPERATWSLPGSVRALLTSRLVRLSETARQLLSTAAVIGRSFDFETLSEASGRSGEETVAGLEELLSQGIIGEVQGEARGRVPVLDFAHEKLRQVVYEETTVVRRRLLHRRVADALISQARNRHATGLLAAQIAGHLQAAGQDREAAEFSRLAGDHARSLYANLQALEHYRAALAFGDPDPASLHEAIGDLQTLSGEYNAALHSYETAIAFCEGVATGGLESKLANVHVRRGEWELAEQHFAGALRAFRDDARNEQRSQIHSDWSLIAHRRGDAPGARKLARKALKLAEASGDRRASAQAHNTLGILARHAGNAEKALVYLNKSLALGQELNDPGIRSAALNNLALVHVVRGDLPQALALARQALEVSAAQGDRHREAALHNNLADILHALGRVDEAMEHLRRAVTIYAEIGAEAGAWQPEIWKLSEW